MALTESAALPANIRWIKKQCTRLAAPWAIIFPPARAAWSLARTRANRADGWPTLLAAGLRSAKVETASAGVVPTPTIAYLTHTHSFSAGVVISASHNPWRDNGIKVFGPDGYKLPDEVELEIETEIFALLKEDAAQNHDSQAEPSLPGDQALRADYLNWLARTHCRR